MCCSALRCAVLCCAVPRCTVLPQAFCAEVVVLPWLAQLCLHLQYALKERNVPPSLRRRIMDFFAAK